MTAYQQCVHSFIDTACSWSTSEGFDTWELGFTLGEASTDRILSPWNIAMSLSNGDLVWEAFKKRLTRHREHFEGFS